MSSHFSAGFFAGNRSRLLAEIDSADAIIVVTANGLLQRNSDNAYPFAQDSNFWYLTGIDEPDIVLVYTSAESFLIVPGRSASREAFDGVVDHSQLRNISGISDVLDQEAGWEKFKSIATGKNAIYTPAAPPVYVEQYGMYANPAREQLATVLREHVSNIDLIDIRQQLAGMRMVKQAPELAAIKEAIQITCDALAELTTPEKFNEYSNEYEIEADLTRYFRYRGAAGNAFAAIIAGGKRACTLHNVANNAKLQPDTLVVLDVGAEVGHYAADITRTCVHGKPTMRQQAVFDAVLDVQNFALGLLKPGTLPKEYESAVEKYMGKTLEKLGLINLTRDETGNRELIRRYYPHSTSHFLGLDVHDVGDYERPLEPGMVLTCEPGIYIPEESIGVRIEDDILITKDGCEILSADLPKALM